MENGRDWQRVDCRRCVLVAERAEQREKNRISDGFRKLQAETERYAATHTRAIILDEAASKAPDGKVYVVAEVEIVTSHVNTPALTPQAAGICSSPEALRLGG